MNRMAIAVDSGGDVFVAVSDNNWIVKLAVRTSAQSVLPFTGLSQPEGVTVDAAGGVYVVDHRNDRVLKLRRGRPARPCCRSPV